MSCATKNFYVGIKLRLQSATKISCIQEKKRNFQLLSQITLADEWLSVTLNVQHSVTYRHS